MDSYTRYKISTIGYGICAIIGVIFLVYSIISANYFLLVICILFIYASLDNFFCSSRAKACNMAAPTHYMIPPFLKK